MALAGRLLRRLPVVLLKGRAQGQSEMRSVLARFLVALLALALTSGNVHARLQLASPERAVPETHLHHHSGTSTQHDQQQNGAVRYCCDGMGCVSAGYTLTAHSGDMTPAIFGIVVCYDREPALLRGQDLLPEPKPPRLGAPS